MWTFLAQPHTVDDIVSYLTMIFSDNPDHSVVKQDVETFIRELVPDFVSEVDADAAKLLFQLISPYHQKESLRPRTL